MTDCSTLMPLESNPCAIGLAVYQEEHRGTGKVVDRNITGKASPVSGEPTETTA